MGSFLFPFSSCRNYRDIWARTTSPNKNIKVYVGAPASSTAAGQGYVDAATLSRIATTMRKNFPSFGGVMLWDASQAYGMSAAIAGSRDNLTGFPTNSKQSFRQNYQECTGCSRGNRFYFPSLHSAGVCTWYKLRRRFNSLLQRVRSNFCLADIVILICVRLATFGR